MKVVPDICGTFVDTDDLFICLNQNRTAILVYRKTHRARRLVVHSLLPLEKQVERDDTLQFISTIDMTTPIVYLQVGTRFILTVHVLSGLIGKILAGTKFAAYGSASARKRKLNLSTIIYTKQIDKYRIVCLTQTSIVCYDLLNMTFTADQLTMEMLSGAMDAANGRNQRLEPSGRLFLEGDSDPGDPGCAQPETRRPAYKTGDSPSRDVLSDSLQSDMSEFNIEGSGPFGRNQILFCNPHLFVTPSFIIVSSFVCGIAKSTIYVFDAISLELLATALVDSRIVSICKFVSKRNYTAEDACPATSSLASFDDSSFADEVLLIGVDLASYYLNVAEFLATARIQSRAAPAPDARMRPLHMSLFNVKSSMKTQQIPLHHILLSPTGELSARSYRLAVADVIALSDLVVCRSDTTDSHVSFYRVVERDRERTIMREVESSQELSVMLSGHTNMTFLDSNQSPIALSEGMHVCETQHKISLESLRRSQLVSFNNDVTGSTIVFLLPSLDGHESGGTCLMELRDCLVPASASQSTGALSEANVGSAISTRISIHGIVTQSLVFAEHPGPVDCSTISVLFAEVFEVFYTKVIPSSQGVFDDILTRDFIHIEIVQDLTEPHQAMLRVTSLVTTRTGLCNIHLSEAINSYAVLVVDKTLVFLFCTDHYLYVATADPDSVKAYNMLQHRFVLDVATEPLQPRGAGCRTSAPLGAPPGVSASVSAGGSGYTAHSFFPTVYAVAAGDHSEPSPQTSGSTAAGETESSTTHGESGSVDEAADSTPPSLLSGKRECDLGTHVLELGITFRALDPHQRGFFLYKFCPFYVSLTIRQNIVPVLPPSMSSEAQLAAKMWTVTDCTTRIADVSPAVRRGGTTQLSTQSTHAYAIVLPLLFYGDDVFLGFFGPRKSVSRHAYSSASNFKSDHVSFETAVLFNVDPGSGAIDAEPFPLKEAYRCIDTLINCYSGCTTFALVAGGTAGGAPGSDVVLLPHRPSFQLVEVAREFALQSPVKVREQTGDYWYEQTFSCISRDLYANYLQKNQALVLSDSPARSPEYKFPMHVSEKQALNPKRIKQNSNNIKVYQDNGRLITSIEIDYNYELYKLILVSRHLLLSSAGSDGRVFASIDTALASQDYTKTVSSSTGHYQGLDVASLGLLAASTRESLRRGLPRTELLSASASAPAPAAHHNQRSYVTHRNLRKVAKKAGFGDCESIVLNNICMYTSSNRVRLNAQNKLIIENSIKKMMILVTDPVLRALLLKIAQGRLNHPDEPAPESAEAHQHSDIRAAAPLLVDFSLFEVISIIEILSTTSKNPYHVSKTLNDVTALIILAFLSTLLSTHDLQSYSMQVESRIVSSFLSPTGQLLLISPIVLYSILQMGNWMSEFACVTYMRLFCPVLHDYMEPVYRGMELYAASTASKSLPCEDFALFAANRPLQFKMQQLHNFVESLNFITSHVNKSFFDLRDLTPERMLAEDTDLLLKSVILFELLAGCYGRLKNTSLVCDIGIESSSALDSQVGSFNAGKATGFLREHFSSMRHGAGNIRPESHGSISSVSSVVGISALTSTVFPEGGDVSMSGSAASRASGRLLDASSGTAEAPQQSWVGHMEQFSCTVLNLFDMINKMLTQGLVIAKYSFLGAYCMGCERRIGDGREAHYFTDLSLFLHTLAYHLFDLHNKDITVSAPAAASCTNDTNSPLTSVRLSMEPDLHHAGHWSFEYLGGSIEQRSVHAHAHERMQATPISARQTISAISAETSDSEAASTTSLVTPHSREGAAGMFPHFKKSYDAAVVTVGELVFRMACVHGSNSRNERAAFTNEQLVCFFIATDLLEPYIRRTISHHVPLRVLNSAVSLVTFILSENKQLLSVSFPSVMQLLIRGIHKVWSEVSQRSPSALLSGSADLYSSEAAATRHVASCTVGCAIIGSILDVLANFSLVSPFLARAHRLPGAKELGPGLGLNQSLASLLERRSNDLLVYSVADGIVCLSTLNPLEEYQIVLPRASYFKDNGEAVPVVSFIVVVERMILIYCYNVSMVFLYSYSYGGPGVKSTGVPPKVSLFHYEALSLRDLFDQYIGHCETLSDEDRRMLKSADRTILQTKLNGFNYLRAQYSIRQRKSVTIVELQFAFDRFLSESYWSHIMANVEENLSLMKKAFVSKLNLGKATGKAKVSRKASSKGISFEISF